MMYEQQYMHLERAFSNVPETSKEYHYVFDKVDF